ncbi:hypothetical protein [Noviluteimonas dokdonensis]|nr:hypothetical protein [Lysobacter dokdonensis]
MLALTGPACASGPSTERELVGCYALELFPERLPVIVTGDHGFTMDPSLPTRVRLTPELHPEFPATKGVHVVARLDANTPDPRQTWQRLEDGTLVLWMADGPYALRVILRNADDEDVWTGIAEPESEFGPVEFKTGAATLRRMACPAA